MASSNSDFAACEPPPRQWTPTVKLSSDATLPAQGSRRTVTAYFTNLTTEQAALLSKVLSDVPSVIASARQKHLQRTNSEIRAAFNLPILAIQKLNAQAWAHERWRDTVLRDLDCISLSEANVRCDRGPWDTRSDLLVLAHRGRSHVPAFQFDSIGVPSSAWITLIGALRAGESRPSDWRIVEWLLRPNPFLNDRSPMNALPVDPQRVRQLAHSAARERLL